MIAPDGNRSAMARSITTRRPLWVEEVPFADGTTGYATDGTPVDCVRLASLGLVEDFEADLVVSGINHGANLGDDITYSGTVAAALEGVVLGLPAIAVSQQSGARALDYPFDGGFGFDVAAAFVARARRAHRGRAAAGADAAQRQRPRRASPSGVEVTSLGKRIYRDELKLEQRGGAPPPLLDLRLLSRASTTSPGTDLAAVAAGRIAVTPIHFDLTDRASLEALRRFDLEALLAPVGRSAGAELRRERPARDGARGAGAEVARARRGAARAARAPRPPLLRPRRPGDRRRRL